MLLDVVVFFRYVIVGTITVGIADLPDDCLHLEITVVRSIPFGQKSSTNTDRCFAERINCSTVLASTSGAPFPPQITTLSAGHVVIRVSKNWLVGYCNCPMLIFKI